MTPLRSATFAFLFFCPLIFFAQSVSLQEAAQENEDWLHEFFQPVPGLNIAINFAGPHGAFTYNRNTGRSVITAFDAKLKQLYSTEIKGLSSKNYQGGLEVDKRLFIFYSGNGECWMDELDLSSGQLKGQQKKLFATENEPSFYAKGFSTDSNWCYAIFKCNSSKSKDENVQGVIMNRPMNIITPFSFQLPEMKSYINSSAYSLTNDGQLFVLNGVRVKPAKDDYRPLQYMVTAIDKKGRASITNISGGLPEGRIDNIVCSASANGFAMTGLLSTTEKTGFTNIFTGTFENDAKKIINAKETVLSTEPYWKKLPGKRFQDGKPEGIPVNARLVNYFQDESGETTMLLQQMETIYTMNGNFSHTDYFLGSIFVVRIKKTAELAWIQLIPLYQTETPSLNYSGCIAVQQNKKDLCVLYHDLEKNTSIEEGDMPALVPLDKYKTGATRLVAVSIKANGSKTTRVVTEKDDSEFHLAPQQPFAVYNDEIVYTSYQLKTAGRSNYRVGLLKIH